MLCTKKKKKQKKNRNNTLHEEEISSSVQVFSQPCRVFIVLGITQPQRCTFVEVIVHNSCQFLENIHGLQSTIPVIVIWAAPSYTQIPYMVCNCERQVYSTNQQRSREFLEQKCHETSFEGECVEEHQKE